MSMQTKLRNAQQQACIRERDRVMRICARIIEQLRKGLDFKLMSTQEKHMAEVKFNIASAIIGAVQIKVMSGDDPDAKAETSPLHRPDTDAVGPPEGNSDDTG